MEKWIVVEFNFEGKARVLNGVYTDWGEAAEVVEAMEWLHDENAYMIFTEEEWKEEVKNGRG